MALAPCHPDATLSLPRRQLNEEAAATCFHGGEAKPAAIRCLAWP